MKAYRLNTLTILICLLISPLKTQEDITDIFTQIEKNYSRIETFIAEAQISIEMERLRIPRKKIKLFYKKPDKFQLHAEGFAMIPRAGLLIFPNQLDKDKYSLKYVTVDTLEKIPLNKYELLFRDTSRIPVGQKFFIWLDKINYFIRQLEMTNFKGRSSKVFIEYGTLKDGYQMPSNITVNFENIVSDQADLPTFPGRERFPTRIPRTGTIKITFTKYEINVELKDDIFQNK